MSRISAIRPQIVPWSTLCRANWVRATRPSFSGSRARPCGSEWASRSIIDGPGQAGAIAGRPAHDHWRTRPAPDAYTHYSPVMIAALSKTAGRSAFDEGRSFFSAPSRMPGMRQTSTATEMVADELIGELFGLADAARLLCDQLSDSRFEGQVRALEKLVPPSLSHGRARTSAITPQCTTALSNRSRRPFSLVPSGASDIPSRKNRIGASATTALSCKKS